jgi:prophage antirepressor-like protein
MYYQRYKEKKDNYVDPYLKSLMTRVIIQKREDKQRKKSNPLMELFLSKDIRVLGDIEDPLFVAIDIGRHIGDEANYRRSTQNFDESCKTVMDINGVKTTILTEKGVYKYLMESKRDEAREFHDYIYDLIKRERLRQHKLMAIKSDVVTGKDTLLPFKYYLKKLEAVMELKYSASIRDLEDYNNLKELIQFDYNNGDFDYAYKRYNKIMKQNFY